MYWDTRNVTGVTKPEHSLNTPKHGLNTVANHSGTSPKVFGSHRGVCSGVFRRHMGAGPRLARLCAAPVFPSPTPTPPIRPPRLGRGGRGEARHSYGA